MSSSSSTATIRPADHPLLEYQFHGLPFERDADELMDLFQKRIPMFRQLNSLTFRELIIESNVIASYPRGPTLDRRRRRDARAAREARSAPADAARDATSWPKATRSIAPGDFGTSFFTIAAGEVTLEVPGTPPRVDAARRKASSSAR